MALETWPADGFLGPIPNWVTRYDGAELQRLIEGEDQLTIIAAIKESESALLLAADTGGTETGGIRLHDQVKLKLHAEAPVAWAGTGVTSVVENFDVWMYAYAWPPKSWMAFRDEAAEQVARINARQRELTAIAGVQPDANDVADILLIGWIGDEPDILEITNRGLASSYIKNGFHALGSGKVIAQIAAGSLQSLVRVVPDVGPQIGQLTKLVVVTEATAIIAGDCDLPIRMCRVTREGVETVL